MDDLESFMNTRQPTAERPLLGLTILVVEDSRFACEAMRLLCLRSGARIRRADSLAAAQRHLQVYRPSVIVVDLGLPDGSGADLIRELSQSNPRVGVILGTSGDPDSEALAMAAGADGYLPKPIENLITFQNTIVSFLPEELRPEGPRLVSDTVVVPDRIAFRDDLAQIAAALDQGADAKTLDYIAQFASGIARSAHDDPLQAAAEALAKVRATGHSADPNVEILAGIVQERLAAGGPI